MWEAAPTRNSKMQLVNLSAVSSTNIPIVSLKDCRLQPEKAGQNVLRVAVEFLSWNSQTNSLQRISQVITPMWFISRVLRCGIAVESTKTLEIQTVPIRRMNPSNLFHQMHLPLSDLQIVVLLLRQPQLVPQALLPYPQPRARPSHRRVTVVSVPELRQALVLAPALEQYC